MKKIKLPKWQNNNIFVILKIYLLLKPYYTNIITTVHLVTLTRSPPDLVHNSSMRGGGVTGLWGKWMGIGLTSVLPSCPFSLFPPYLPCWPSAGGFSHISLVQLKGSFFQRGAFLPTAVCLRVRLWISGKQRGTIQLNSIELHYFVILYNYQKKHLIIYLLF